VPAAEAGVVIPREPTAPPRHLGATGRLRFLARNRYQILGALILAVLLPALLRSRLALLDTSIGSAQWTVFGTAVAVLTGAFVLRRLTIYPGAQSLAYVFPVFAAVFAAVVVGFFFARIDYSRLQFLMSIVFAIAWFLFVLRIERQNFRPRYLLLPFGDTASLRAWAEAEWVIAATPNAAPAGFSAVVADLRADIPAEWQRMLADAALHGVPIYHSKQLAESLSGRVEIEHISENNLGALLPSSLYLRCKRVLDLGITLATLPVVLPILGVAALLILVIDGRPVFFRQERIGFRGERFTVVKFRTMMCDEPDAGPHFTAERDPRITRLGRKLRHSRIDELPQIINVLRGEMSWIGPRPEAVQLSEWYEDQIPFYSYRHIVRPGISGWAAVNQGNVAEIGEARAKLQFDFYYIKHFSLWLDMLIVAKTVHTVLTGFGAR